MQLPRAAVKPAVGIIFDCDMGNRIDDVLALALLYGLDGKNEARVVSISSTKSNLKSAALADAMLRFFTLGFSRALPVGMADNGKLAEDTPILTEVLAKKNAEGKPAYQHQINTLNDTAECSALIRNALTAQHDGNAIVVLGGPATNLAGAMMLPGVPDLIARKVRYMVVSTGSLKADPAAAAKVLSAWPTPVFGCGDDVGEALPFPADAIEKSFAWAPAHPVVDAYRAFKQMPYDAATTDMAAMLYAIRPKEGYFKLSDPGTFKMSNSGVEFAPAGDGKHRQLIVDPAQKDRIVKAYVELVSIKPVPRRPRFFPQQQQQQVPPPKPGAPKPPSSGR